MRYGVKCLRVYIWTWCPQWLLCESHRSVTQKSKIYISIRKSQTLLLKQKALSLLWNCPDLVESSCSWWMTECRTPGSSETLASPSPTPAPSWASPSPRSSSQSPTWWGWSRPGDVTGCHHHVSLLWISAVSPEMGSLGSLAGEIYLCAKRISWRGIIDWDPALLSLYREHVQ